RDHLDLDAEIRELDLDEPRHPLERLGRVAALALRRIIEQRQRRQLAGRDRLRLEQRHLTLTLDTHARLDPFQSRLDARRLQARLAAALGDDLVPLLLRAAALEKEPDAADEHVQLRDAGIDDP